MVVRLLAAASVVGCLSGCATLESGADGGGAERTVWNARDQFVTVVPRERGESAPFAANGHPATVPPAEIRRLLASPRVSPGGKDGAVPLFTETELKVLGDAVATGLQQSSSDEEVVFAVFGYHPALMGLAREPKVTTGRIFLQDGGLNLILGIVHRDVNENEDRRLYPFVPGSRLRQSAIAGRITPVPGGVHFSMKRNDWLVFTPAGSAPPVEVAPRPEPPLPAAREPAEQPPLPRGPQDAIERPPGKAGSIEERLMILNDLRNKKLITEEEYRAKRLEILNEL